jgi:hypothetical protein
MTGSFIKQTEFESSLYKRVVERTYSFTQTYCIIKILYIYIYIYIYMHANLDTCIIKFGKI